MHFIVIVVLHYLFFLLYDSCSFKWWAGCFWKKRAEINLTSLYLSLALLFAFTVLWKPQKGRKKFVTVHESASERGRDIRQAYIHCQDNLLFKAPKTVYISRERRSKEGRYEAARQMMVVVGCVKGSHCTGYRKREANGKVKDECWRMTRREEVCTLLLWIFVFACIIFNTYINVHSICFSFDRKRNIWKKKMVR